jgi:hypothetical protein
VISLGGAGLLAKYNDSLTKALETIYPGKSFTSYLFSYSTREKVVTIFIFKGTTKILE